MRISDWSSDVCSSDLIQVRLDGAFDEIAKIGETPIVAEGRTLKLSDVAEITRGYEDPATFLVRHQGEPALELGVVMKDRYNGLRSEEHTSELQSLMRLSYAVFCLKKKKRNTNLTTPTKRPTTSCNQLLLR